MSTKITKRGTGLVHKGDPRAALRAAIEKKDRIEKAVARGVGVGREHLVLCLDYSASMFDPVGSTRYSRGAGPTKKEAMIDAVESLLAASKHSDVAIIGYGKNATYLATRGTSHHDMVRALDAQSMATTHGARALDLAQVDLASSQGHARRIVFMSDGQDANPNACFDRARELIASGVTIDTVAFGHDADRAFLDRLRSPNGVMKEANDAASLKREFLQLEAGIRGLLGAGS